MNNIPTETTGQRYDGEDTEEEEEIAQDTQKKTYSPPTIVDNAPRNPTFDKEIDPEDKKSAPSNEVWKNMSPLENGLEAMTKSIYEHVEPLLLHTNERMCDLLENQQSLVSLLRGQRRVLRENDALQLIESVLTKVPHYQMQLLHLREFMVQISARVEKLKKRSSDLQVEYQTRAIAVEEEKDAKYQWNQLYAAKTTDSTIHKKN